MITNVSTSNGTHGAFESSNLKSTDIGNIWDVLVRDGSNNAIDVDNGVPVAVGEYTGNGLQERYGTLAVLATPHIAVTGNPPIDPKGNKINDIFNYYTPAGKLAKCYEVVKGDIFAVRASQVSATVTYTADSESVTRATGVGDYIVVNTTAAATGVSWTAVAKEGTVSSSAKFVGKIHSYSTSGDMVRILVVQNAD